MCCRSRFGSSTASRRKESVPGNTRSAQPRSVAYLHCYRIRHGCSKGRTIYRERILDVIPDMESRTASGPLIVQKQNILPILYSFFRPLQSPPLLPMLPFSIWTKIMGAVSVLRLAMSRRKLLRLFSGRRSSDCRSLCNGSQRRLLSRHQTARSSSSDRICHIFQPSTQKFQQHLKRCL